MNAFDEYHELAARLLNKKEFPLPLPRWDRDYPHNIGLLSDAEESELAAAVLQKTHGMRYESWQHLTLDERLPWMRIAVGKLGTGVKEGSLSITDVLRGLAERADAKTRIVEADEVVMWPDGLLETLVTEGVLRPTDNATSVVCDACGRDHVEKVEYVQSPPGTGLRAYIGCPENGRVRVPLTRLRRWTVDTVPLRRIRSEEQAEGEAARSGPLGTDELTIDDSSFSVSWRGSALIEIGNKKEFSLLQELAKSSGKYVAFSDLAERLGGDAMDQVTHIKSRLVKLLRNNGLGELAECIKTQKGHYGLFLS